jgi:hypothetical protein
MKTESNSTLAAFVGASLSRDEIAALLVAYYGAVVLDRFNADELCEKCRRGKDSKQECREYRRKHLGQIWRLLETLSFVSQELLAKLTVLAATRNPAVVRKAMIELLELGAFARDGDLTMYEAPEFFTALVRDAEAGAARAPKDGEEKAERMMRWLNPVDPLRLSRRCGYTKRIAPKIWSWPRTDGSF